VSCITIKDKFATVSLACDQVRVAVDGKMGHVMPGEHLADELPNPTIAHNNNARRPAIWLRC